MPHAFRSFAVVAAATLAAIVVVPGNAVAQTRGLTGLLDVAPGTVRQGHRVTARVGQGERGPEAATAV